MVGATDYEKARMQIRWLKQDIRKICSTVWFTSERLKEAEGNVFIVPAICFDSFLKCFEFIFKELHLGALCFF